MRAQATSASATRRATGPTRDAIVLAGGDPVAPPLVRSLPQHALVIAADQGLGLAGPLHLAVDLLVGDLDSVAPDALAAAVASGTEVERHPVDKDRTDLALALDAAARAGATRVTVVGGAGGRLDHLLGGMLLLAAPRYAELDIVVIHATAVVTVVRSHGAITGEVGEYVSLLPVHGSAAGTTTTGLRFPLQDEPLDAGSSRGVSNELVARRATVTVRSGVLLVVQPDATAPAPDGGTQ